MEKDNKGKISWKEKRGLCSLLDYERLKEKKKYREDCLVIYKLFTNYNQNDRYIKSPNMFVLNNIFLEDLIPSITPSPFHFCISEL